ncbi:MAG: NADH-quinone oxidoreductase subunit NuoN [Candidatus Dasytiphilus stammeri]
MIKLIIALLPLLIIGLTTIIVMLFIALKRNHFYSVIIAISGMILAMMSLYFFKYVNGAIFVTSLLVIDSYSLFFSVMILLAAIVTCIFAYLWLESDPVDNKEEFYLLVLIATMGGILLSSTNNFASLLIGMELISIPLFGLSGYSYSQKYSLEACIKYTIPSAIASSFFIFGIALIYAQYGNLNFLEIEKSITSESLQPLLIVGFGLLLVSFGFKISLVPFHLVTPDVYQGAPVPVTTFLSTASKIAVFGALTKFLISVSIMDNLAIRTVLGIMAFLSILCGNLMAMYQTNIKRLLGYSSIAHFGYLVTALITIPNNPFFLETVNFYLFSYLLSSLGLFGIVSIISSNYPDSSQVDNISYYRGLFWSNPILTSAMTIMILSLAGIPLTLGFFGKFGIILLNVSARNWWLTFAIVMGSAMSIYYYLRLTVNLYLFPHKRILTIDPIYESTRLTVFIIIMMLAILVILWGIFPQSLISITQLAKPQLLFKESLIPIYR